MGRRGAHNSPPRRHDGISTKPNRGDYYSGHGTHPAKRQEKANISALQTSNKQSVNSLKSKIRDLTRSLDHNEDMPAGVRIEKERAVAGYKQDLENAEQEKRKQAIISRYHRIRFFERQKATRHVKKAKKRLEASELNEPEHAAAQQDVHIAEVDLNYTLYCPLDQKYEAIYPREANDRNGSPMVGAEEHGNGADGVNVLPSRPAMWNIVEICMRNGTLDALRNGKLTTKLAVGGNKPASAKAHARGPGGGVMINFGTAPESTTARPPQEQDSSDESDGGFFEKGGPRNLGQT